MWAVYFMININHKINQKSGNTDMLFRYDRNIKWEMKILVDFTKHRCTVITDFIVSNSQYYISQISI